MSNLRTLMESIDDIFSAADDMMSESEEAQVSPAQIVKDIIGSLKELSTMIADGSIEQHQELLSDLQNISSSLKELVGTDSEGSVEEDSGEWSNDFESDVGEDDLEEDYGAEGMGPSFDADGTQNYENPQGSSYPEKKGFVGI